MVKPASYLPYCIILILRNFERNDKFESVDLLYSCNISLHYGGCYV